ncbi:MAG: hypothetical protein U0792_05560 [Gemmataceae bacterium]
MAESVSINLAKSQNLKNRLAGRITKLTQTVHTYNSTQETAEPIVVQAAERDGAV